MSADLLRFIRKTETSYEDIRAYDTVYGHNEHKLTKRITDMTLAEVQKWQPGFSKYFDSSATGAYQFMYATLKDLIKQEKLALSTKFTPDLQDALAMVLLERRGYDEFMAGKIDEIEFGKRLAMEWASFPVLEDTQGRHRRVKKGQTYYAGDALNRALVKPEEVLAVLRGLKETPTVPIEKPEELTIEDNLAVIEQAVKNVRRLLGEL